MSMPQSAEELSTTTQAPEVSEELSIADQDVPQKRSAMTRQKRREAAEVLPVFLALDSIVRQLLEMSEWERRFTLDGITNYFRKRDGAGAGATGDPALSIDFNMNSITSARDPGSDLSES